jgi:uncharacterized membrane protein YcaP (DUF421 family)
MRLLGKRMAAQLDRIDLAALVTLAAAIGVPLQAPDRGLLPAVVIAAVVVSLGTVIGRLSFKSEKFESLTHGSANMLMENGAMRLSQMLTSRVTPERLLAELRTKGLTHLGQLRRVYAEANGSFSLIEAEEPRPGLCIIPAWDTDFREQLKEVPEIEACTSCGFTRERASSKGHDCSNCQGTSWVTAVQ